MTHIRKQTPDNGITLLERRSYVRYGQGKSRGRNGIGLAEPN